MNRREAKATWPYVWNFVQIQVHQVYFLEEMFVKSHSDLLIYLPFTKVLKTKQSWACHSEMYEIPFFCCKPNCIRHRKSISKIQKGFCFPLKTYIPLASFRFLHPTRTHFLCATSKNFNLPINGMAKQSVLCCAKSIEIYGLSTQRFWEGSHFVVQGWWPFGHLGQIQCTHMAGWLDVLDPPAIHFVPMRKQDTKLGGLRTAVALALLLVPCIQLFWFCVVGFPDPRGQERNLKYFPKKGEQFGMKSWWR